MQMLTELTLFRVTLTSGITVEVWATGFEVFEGVYSFGVLVTADEEPPTVLVTNRTPADPTRFIVALARFPVEAVENIISG